MKLKTLLSKSLSVFVSITLLAGQFSYISNVYAATGAAVSASVLISEAKRLGQSHNTETIEERQVTEIFPFAGDISTLTSRAGGDGVYTKGMDSSENKNKLLQWGTESKPTSSEHCEHQRDTHIARATNLVEGTQEHAYFLAEVERQYQACMDEICKKPAEGTDPNSLEHHEYQYCLAREHLANSSMRPNSYDTIVDGMVKKDNLRQNTFLSMLGINDNLKPGECIETIVDVPGSKSSKQCSSTNFSGFISHQKERATEHWSYESPYCAHNHPSLPIELLLSKDRGSCEVRYCPVLEHTYDGARGTCTFITNAKGGVATCMNEYEARHYSQPADCPDGFNLVKDPDNSARYICERFDYYSCDNEALEIEGFVVGYKPEGAFCHDQTGLNLHAQANCTPTEYDEENKVQIYYCKEEAVEACTGKDDSVENCTLISEKCQDKDEDPRSPSFGECLSTLKEYTCEEPSQAATVTRCGGADTICIDGTCFSDNEMMCDGSLATVTRYEDDSCSEERNQAIEQCGVDRVIEMFPTEHCKANWRDFEQYNKVVNKRLVGYDSVEDCPKVVPKVVEILVPEDCPWNNPAHANAKYPYGCKHIPFGWKFGQDEELIPDNSDFACWNEWTYNIPVTDPKALAQGVNTQSGCAWLAQKENCEYKNKSCIRYSDYFPEICLEERNTYSCSYEQVGNDEQCTGDFVNVMIAMEAARQAGIYFEEDEMKVFKGEMATCLHRSAYGLGSKNCCNSKSVDPQPNSDVMSQLGSGKGQIIQAVASIGSTFLFDSSMTDNKHFQEAMDAAITAYAIYDTSVAVMELIAKSQTGTPWGLILMVVIMVWGWYQGLLACDQNDFETTGRRKAGLCYEYESDCIKSWKPPWGGSICEQREHRHCCFNSKLARIINQQGKPQLGKPISDCSGFHFDDFQKLDFDRIDFSEFVNDILTAAKANLPGSDTMEQLKEKVQGGVARSTGSGEQPGFTPLPANYVKE